MPMRLSPDGKPLKDRHDSAPDMFVNNEMNS